MRYLGGGVAVVTRCGIEARVESTRREERPIVGLGGIRTLVYSACWSACILGVWAPRPAAAQLRILVPNPNVEPDGERELKSVVVRAPRELQGNLDNAREQLANEQGVIALQLLQRILDAPEDYFYDETLQISLKQTVERLLQELPTGLRDNYQVQFGATAQALKQRIDVTDHLSARQELLSRFAQTSAGRAQLIREAAVAFDRNANVAAGRWWEQLRSTGDVRQQPAWALQHGLAWMRADRPDLVARAFRESPPLPGATLRLGDQVVTVPAEPLDDAWLRKAFPQLVGRPDVGETTWLTYRGSTGQNGGILNAGPVGAPAWHRSLLQDYPRWTAAEFGRPRAETEFAGLVSRMIERLQVEGKLSLPGFAPLVVDQMVVVRTPFGLSAFDLRTGAVRWRSAVRTTALVPVWSQGTRRPETEEDEDLSPEATALVQQRTLEIALQEWLLRNQTAGLLSSNGSQVFAVEQLPHVVRETQIVGFGVAAEPSAPLSNLLVAYDVSGGRVLWELGGRRQDRPSPLAGTYFLGPPCCLHDRLYCLAETSGELRLLQFHQPEPEAAPVLEWSQVIAAPQVPLQSSTMRRLAGLIPAAADDLLICQTAAGLVAAVDPLRRQLVWGYEYPTLEIPESLDRRQLAINRIQGRPTFAEPDENESRWIDSGGIVSAGRIVLTPRDSTELHCLDAVTGELQWKRPRERAIYVAGVREGRVVVVGRERIEAFHLQTGEPAWSAPLPIAEPSGRGLFVDQHYVIPLSTGEIARIDTTTGQLRMRTRMSSGRIPGHLAASAGALISQNHQELVVYRPLPEIEEQIARTLQINPEEPAALALRGELRLQRQEDAEGMADLRKSLRLQPNAQASLVLVDLLMSRLRSQFPDNPDPIVEVEQLIQDPHQLEEFVELTAQGFEHQGKLLPAFQQYLKLTNQDLQTTGLLRLNEALNVRRDRMIRGRLLGLYARATTEDRLAMERELLLRFPANREYSALEWQQALRFFDGFPPADRWRLSLLQKSAAGMVRSQLNQWLQLVDSPDTQIAGYATGRLAKSALEIPSPVEARVWLDRLQQRYSTVELLPGQTGAALMTRWQEEIKQVLDQEPRDWPAVLQAHRAQRPPAFSRTAIVELIGPPHPVYRDWTFEFSESSTATLRARDRTGRVQWEAPLPGSLLQSQPHFSPRMAAPRLWISGANFVLSFGTSFVVLDVATGDGTPRYLWQRSLTPETTGLLQQSSVTVRVEFMRSGRRRVRAVEVDADLQSGQVLGVTPQQVCYQLGNRVIAADVETGQPLWIRSDLPAQTEGTADARHVLLLDTISQEAIVLRAVDGEILARRNIPDAHQWIELRGEQLLTFSLTGTDRQLQRLDLLRGTAVWSLPVASESRCCVAGNDVVCVEPGGSYRVLRLSDGAELASGSASRVPHLDFVWAQAERDGYLVVAGAFSPPGQDRQVSVYDGNQVPMTGVAFRLERGQKTPAWSVDLEPTAFHFIQPASVPVLAFAGRVITRVPTTNFRQPPPPAKLSALFLDRRTGTVLQRLEDSPPPGMFQLEISGERQQVVANFLSFGIEMRGAQPGEAAPDTPAPQN